LRKRDTVLLSGLVVALLATITLVAHSGGDCGPGGGFSVLKSGESGTATQFDACITPHGNVILLGPYWEYSFYSEGYRLCDSSGHEYTSAASDLDDHTEWGNETVIVNPLAVVRTTTDGRWRLRQAFALDPKELDLTITATLTRLGAPVSGVWLMRRTATEVSDTVATSWIPGFRSVAFAGSGHIFLLTGLTPGFAVTAGTGPAYDFLFNTGCTRASQPVPVGDYPDARVTYELGSFATGQRKVVQFQYSRR
jgi:hypothetical protein